MRGERYEKISIGQGFKPWNTAVLRYNDGFPSAFAFRLSGFFVAILLPTDAYFIR